MTAFFQALEQGYTPEQVLGYISKALPQMSPMIKKAQRAGYPAQQIIGFLSKNFDTEDRRGMSESERHAANRRADSERTKYGLQLAGAAIATPLAARAAQGAIARALPSSLTQGVGQSLAPNNQLTQNAENPLGTGSEPIPGISQQGIQQPISPSQPPVSPSIPNAAAPVQPEGISNISELIKKHGFEKQIEEISQNVKDPKGVAAILYNKFPKEMKKLQKESGKLMEEVVAEYMQSNVKPFDTVESEPKAPMTREEALGKFRDKIIENHSTIQPIQKGETVASPQGIGEIKEIRNGKALVQIDGKKHQISEDELIQSPIPEKDLAELYEDLTRGIEKETGQEISRNVEYAAYSPENNELLYKPHSGDFYVYDDISPEVADELVNLLTERRSTGKNHIGAWEKGTRSIIGSRMHDLIQKLQTERGGKGKEYRSRYQTIYGALEPAQEAKKRAYEEKRKKAKKPRLD